MPKNRATPIIWLLSKEEELRLIFRYAVICVASVKAAEVLLYKVLKKTDLIIH